MADFSKMSDADLDAYIASKSGGQGPDIGSNPVGAKEEPGRELGFTERMGLRAQADTGANPSEAYDNEIAKNLSNALYNVAPFAGMAGRMNEGAVRDAISEVIKTGNVPTIDVMTSANPLADGMFGGEAKRWDAEEGRKYDLYAKAERGETEGTDFSSVFKREMKDGRYKAVTDANGNTLLDERYSGGEEAKKMARQAHMRQYAATIGAQYAGAKQSAGVERAKDLSPWYSKMMSLGAENLGFGAEFVLGGAAMEGFAATGVLGTSSLNISRAAIAGKKAKDVAGIGARIAYASGELAIPTAINAAARYEQLTADDMSVDDNGDLIYNQNADGSLKAAGKAIVGAAAENAVEVALGDVVGKMVGGVFKGANKAVGGRLTSMFDKGVGKSVKNAWFDLARNYSKVQANTKFGNPIGEFAEEYVQGALDEAAGFDVKGDENAKSLGEFSREFFDWDANAKELTLGILGQMAIQAGYGHAKDRASLNKASWDSRITGALKLRGFNNWDQFFMGAKKRIALGVMANEKELKDAAGNVVSRSNSVLDGGDFEYGLRDVMRFAGIDEKAYDKMSAGEKGAVLNTMNAVMNDPNGAVGVMDKLNGSMKKYLAKIDQQSMLDGNWKDVADASSRKSRVNWLTVSDSAGNIQWITDEKGRRYIESATQDGSDGARIYANEDGSLTAFHPNNGFTATFQSMGDAANWLDEIDRAVQVRDEKRDLKKRFISNVANRLAPEQTDKDGNVFGANVVTFNNVADALESNDVSESDKAALRYGGEQPAITSSDGTTVYVFADNIHGADDALFTVAHELGRHVAPREGVKDAEGNERKGNSLDAVIASVFKNSKVADKSQAAGEYVFRKGMGASDADAEATAKEEGLAYGGETAAPVASPLRRAVTAVKMWARDTFGENAAELTDDDYAAIAYAGLRRIRRTTGVKAAEGGRERFGFDETVDADVSDWDIEVGDNGRSLAEAENRVKWVSDYSAQRDALAKARAEADNREFAAAEAKRKAEKAAADAATDAQIAKDQAAYDEEVRKQEEERKRIEQEQADANAATLRNREGLADLLEGWYGGEKNAERNAVVITNATDAEVNDILDAVDAEMNGDDWAAEEAVNRVYAAINERKAEERANTPIEEEADDKARNKARRQVRSNFVDAVREVSKSISGNRNRTAAMAALKRAVSGFRQRPGMPWTFKVSVGKDADGKAIVSTVTIEPDNYGRISERRVTSLVRTIMPNANAKTMREVVGRIVSAMDIAATERVDFVKANADAEAAKRKERAKKAAASRKVMTEDKARRDMERYIEEAKIELDHIKAQKPSGTWVDDDGYVHNLDEAGVAAETERWQEQVNELERNLSLAQEELAAFDEMTDKAFEAARNEWQQAVGETAEGAPVTSVKDLKPGDAIDLGEGQKFEVVENRGNEIVVDFSEFGDNIVLRDNNGKWEVIGYEQIGTQVASQAANDGEGSAGGRAAGRVDERTRGDAGAVARKDGGDRAAASASRTSVSGNAEAVKGQVDGRIANLREVCSDDGTPQARFRRAKDAGLVTGTMADDIAKLNESRFADGEVQKSGAESIVRRVGDKVVKYRVTNGLTDGDFNKVEYHNALFPETAYTSRRIVEDAGSPFGHRIVLDQPYVDAKPNSGTEARRQIVQRLRNRFGADNVTTSGDIEEKRLLRPSEWFAVDVKTPNGVYHITDLKDLNVGVDADGIGKAWDAEIEFEPKDVASDGGETRTMFRRGTSATSNAVTPAEDAAYMDAVKRGDMETAERMVREAAAKAMPDTKVVGEDGLPLVVYHGSNSRHNTYHQNESFHASDRIVAESYAKRGERVVQGNFLNIRNPLVIDADGSSWISVDTPPELTNAYNDGDTVQDDGENDIEFDSVSMSVRSIADFAKELGYDGVIVRNVEDSNLGDQEPTTDYVSYSSNQVKSADPVTYDDAGNVIPLSQRFNPQNADIRYNPSELKGSENGEDNAGRPAVEDGADRRAGRDASHEPRVTPQTVRIADGEASFDFRGGRAYGTGDIEKLYRALNSNGDSARIADRVFGAAKKLGVSYSFGELEANDGSIAAAGAEFPGGYVLYDTRHLNSSSLSPQTKADFMLHEAIHAVTSYAINIVNGTSSAPAGVTINDNLRNAVSELKAIHAEVSRILPDEYGSTHETEFVAELAKGGFRDKLKGLGLWDRIARAIARIVNAIVGRESVHDAAMRNLGDFLDNIDEDAFKATRTNTLKLGGRNFSEATGVENADIRWRRSGLYTGSAADYDKPSLVHVGTGEGSQVYGWGLYGTTLRKNAERDIYDKRMKNLYEQTFFTDRERGDESRLLDWDGQATLDQKKKIAEEANKEFSAGWTVTEQGLVDSNGVPFDDRTGRDLYGISKMLIARNKRNADNIEQLTSEFLARSGIDGVKAPDIRYGKSAKDDKLGNIYVSFRDDNIRVDHKWVDGKQVFRRSYTPDPAARQLADQLGLSPNDALNAALYTQSGAAALLSEVKRKRDLVRRGTLSPEAEKAINATTTGTTGSRIAGTYNYLKTGDFADRMRVKFQDAMLPLRRMEEHTNGGSGIGKNKSAYYAFDANHGKAAEEISRFERDVVAKLSSELAKRNLTPENGGYDDLQMYLLALHGPERNRMIAERSEMLDKAKRTPARQYIDAIISGGMEIDDKALDDIAKLASFTPNQRNALRRELSGSGASTKFWNDRLAEYNADGRAAKMKDAANLVHEMTRRTREILVKSGRLNAQQAAAWESLSPNYVPLRTNTETEQSLVSRFIHGNKGGGTKRGSAFVEYGNGEFNHAYGRATIADDPIGAAIEQFHDAVTRSYNNDARAKLASIVRGDAKLGYVFSYKNENERKELAKKISILENAKAAGKATQAQLDELVKAKRELDEANNGDKAIPRTKVIGDNGVAHSVPNLSGLEGAKGSETSIIAFKENGELKYIKLGGFTQDEVRNSGALADNDALSIARAVKLHGIYSSELVKYLRKLTGIFSAMRTAFSPTFVVSNLAADRRQAAANIMATFGANGLEKFSHYQFNSFNAAIAVLSGYYDMALKSHQFAKEWADGGGRIGGRATENLAEIRDAMKRDINLILKNGKVLAEIKSPKDLAEALAGRGSLKDKIGSLAQFSEFWNSVVEMSTRIAAYSAYRDMTSGNGKSNEENIADAVSYSRDITVNFNRKGELTPIFNAIYAFSNANIQDLHRSLVALSEGDKIAGATGLAKFVGKGGLAMYGITAIFGFLRALLGYAQDDEDEAREGKPQYEDTPEHVKQNNFGFRVGKYDVSVPIRGFSRLPYYLGHSLHEFMFGKKSIGKAALDNLMLAKDVFAEAQGASSDLLGSFVPSVVRPAYDLAVNKTFSGSQIYREPFGGDNDKITVRSELGRSRASSSAKIVARTLNALTGGDKNERGLIDVQPEKIDYVWQWMLGSVGKDVSNAVQTLTDIATFNGPKVENVPFVNRVVKPVKENTRRFYEARDEYDKWVKYYNEAETLKQVRRAIDNAPYLEKGNERWAKEVKDLKGIVTNLLKRETQATDKAEFDEIHKWRMKSQYLFMHRLTHDPREDERDNREDERKHNRIVDKFLNAKKRNDKRDEKRNERERRSLFR